MTKHKYKGQSTFAQNIMAKFMKGIIKDKLTTLTLENLKEHRERDAKELAKSVK